MIRKKERYALFLKITSGAYLADMQLIRNYNNLIHYSLCIINIFSKYAWIFPFKEKKCMGISFQKILDKFNCKPNKIYSEKGSEFCSKLMKSWLQDNYIEIYSTNN